MSQTRTVLDRISVLDDGQIEVSQHTVVTVEGVDYHQTRHGHVVSPGDDLSREYSVVAAIAGVVHTSEVVAAFQTARAQQKQDRP
jgi:predicted dinucleotide-binding enzyme